jgi:BolA protein
MSTADLIRERLAALEPETYTLEDESAQHKGMPALPGRRTFPPHTGVAQVPQPVHLARHRLVYEAMGGPHAARNPRAVDNCLNPEEL